MTYRLSERTAGKYRNYENSVTLFGDSDAFADIVGYFIAISGQRFDGFSGREFGFSCRI